MQLRSVIYTFNIYVKLSMMCVRKQIYLRLTYIKNVQYEIVLLFLFIYLRLTCVLYLFHGS